MLIAGDVSFGMVIDKGRGQILSALSIVFFLEKSSKLQVSLCWTVDVGVFYSGEVETAYDYKRNVHLTWTGYLPKVCIFETPSHIDSDTAIFSFDGIDQ